MIVDEQTIFDILVACWFLLALATFPILFFVPAPYGRYTEGRARYTIPRNLGWMVMESPAVLVFGTMFAVGTHRNSIAAIVFLVMWMSHYIQRTFVYSFLQRGRKRIPVQVVAMAFFFNAVNGYLNGRYLFEFSGGYPAAWLIRTPFLMGVALFAMGYVINRHADGTLRGLRPAGTSGYKVPYGGLYRWVSCPNYLGEISIWVGWAIATWSTPGLAFAIWTIANLAPRAWSHHKWYQEQFADYPPNRKALLPGVW